MEHTTHLDPLVPGFSETREALRALACFVIAPARKVREGRIGLRPTGDGFGTPELADGTRVLVRGDNLHVEPGRTAPITTLREAAELVGVELSADPGVGHDLPPFEPDRQLPVAAAASLALGRWYAFASDALTAVAGGIADGETVSEAQLWPEHFDHAVTVGLAGGEVNVGFSPGDDVHDEPYAYVGPHDTTGFAGRGYWNAPFGALLPYAEIVNGPDQRALAVAFVAEGLDRCRAGPGRG